MKALTYAVPALAMLALAGCSDADVASANISRAADQKHFLGLSDNVTFFAEQLEPAAVNTYRYRVIFKPSVIIPDINVKLGM
jgi:hypothetical protein